MSIKFFYDIILKKLVTREINTILQYVALSNVMKHAIMAWILKNFTHVIIGSVKPIFSIAGR